MGVVSMALPASHGHRSRADDPVRLVRAICQQRRGFLRRLRIFSVFGRGWLRRVDGSRQFALALTVQRP
jgi:lysozyme family protein